MSPSLNIHNVLAKIAARWLFGALSKSELQATRDKLLGIMRDAEDTLSQSEWQELTALADSSRASPGKPPPPRLVALLRQALGTVGLALWADAHSPSRAPPDP